MAVETSAARQPLPFACTPPPQAASSESGHAGARPWLRVRLRTWLIWLSLISMLPVLALSGSMLWRLLDQQQKERVDLLQQRSNDTSRAVAARIHLATSTLRGLAASRAARNGDLVALHEQSRLVLRQTPEIRAIVLANARGELLFLTSVPFGTRLKPAAYPELVDRALKTGQPNVSGAFVSPIGPLKVVAVTVPLAPRPDVPPYVLRAILTTDSLNELLMEQENAQGWVMGIADREGTLVARNLSPERYVGVRASESFVEAIWRADGKVFQGSTLDGIRTTNLVLPIYAKDWYLGVGVPNELLNAPAWEMLRSMALLALAWLALALTVSSLFAAYLVRQMRKVSEMARSDTLDLAEDSPLLVVELRAIAQELVRSRRHVASARSDLTTMTLARDEVQDLYENAPCGYHSLDREGRFVRINQTELDWLGRSREEVMGQPLLNFVAEHSKEAFREAFARFWTEGEVKDVELELIRSTGSPMPVLISATAIRNPAGEIVMTRAMVFDNTERKSIEAQLDRLARTDPLTNLSNRRDFYDRAEQELARSRRHGHPLTLLMIDIDYFKSVNDTHGHAVGDRVLKHLSQVLRDLLRENDMPARLGGEEFAVLLPDTPEDAGVEVAERIRRHLVEHPMVTEAQTPLPFTVSTGTAAWREGDADVDPLIHRADLALYAAKRGGRNRVVRS